MKTRQLKIEEINAIRAGLELLRRTMENGEDLEPVAHHLYNPDGGNCLDDDEIGVLDGELEGAVVFVGGAPSKGYVRGNVRVVSMRANHLKSDASVEEFIAVCEDLLRLHKKGWPLGDQVCRAQG